MALTSLQHSVLLAIARNRSPDSHIAGATPLNVKAPRLSSDIDIFHDDPDKLEATANLDATILTREGFRVTWIRSLTTVKTASVSRGQEETKIEWVHDSDFRFFPALKDPVFGYRLHMFDLAANKVAAAAGRREARDIVDLVEIDKAYMPLGAIITAAADKFPGFTPEGIIAEIRRNAMRPASEYHALASEDPIDPAAIHTALKSALDTAEEFAIKLPSQYVGAAFVRKLRPEAPDLNKLNQYTVHRSARRGHWPDSPAVRHAMWKSYRDGNER